MVINADRIMACRAIVAKKAASTSSRFRTRLAAFGLGQ
jgi:hypothetical protein